MQYHQQRRSMSELRRTYTARCRCGKVELAADGPHIAHISCYCDDCQAAAARIDGLRGGASGQEADGGTPNVLFRKDRVRCVRGVELLQAHRTREGTFTDRLVASCCNTALTQIHHNWWPHRGIKAHRIMGDVPPLEMRIFTKFAADPSTLPSDVPRHATVPLRFAARLIREALAIRLARG